MASMQGISPDANYILINQGVNLELLNVLQASGFAESYF